MNDPDASGRVLDGKVAVVAGGAGGIGSAVTRLLAAAGAAVVSLDRAPAAVAEGVSAVRCDLVRDGEVREAVERVVGDHGRLDIVVHCAGVTRDGVLWKLSNEDWSTVIGTNLDSAFYLLRAAVPPIRTSGGGAVVLVSSINGERGKAGQANYAASKGGVNALAKSAALELGRFNIRVNAVAPGWIETPMTEALSGELRERAVRETALGRVGQPDDVARAILFLSCDWSRHITGQVLRVDGGQLTA